jgi:hypothetical protein
VLLPPLSQVSVYESGSSDKTHKQLKQLGEALHLIGVRSSIVWAGELTRQVLLQPQATMGFSLSTASTSLAHRASPIAPPSGPSLHILSCSSDTAFLVAHSDG